MRRANASLSEESRLFSKIDAELFQQVAEALPHPLLIINVDDYTVAYANGAASQFPSRKNLTCHALFHNRDKPCDGEEQTCPVREIKKTKQPVTLEHRHHYKHKGPVDVEVTAYPLLDDSGRVVQIIESCIDVTKHKKFEEELLQSEHFLNTVIKTTGEGIIVIEGDSKIRMTSRELCRIFGYSQGELVGKELQILMPEKYRAHHGKRIREYLNGAPPKILGKRVVLEGLRKDGTIFPIELRIEESREGEKLFFTGAIRDISERKEMEESLINSEEAFRTLVQSINGYLYSIRYDEKGNVSLIYHSPQCELITGYRPQDYVDEPHLWQQMIHGDDVSSVLSFFNNLQIYGDSNRIEHRIIKKNGDIIWVLNQCTVRLTDEGRARRTDGLILDITEHKKAEQALKESERNFRTIFESAVDGILITDRDTKKIFLANEMICRMLGYDHDEIINLNIMNIHPEEARPHIMQKFERQSRGETNLAEDLPVKRKDGTIFYADINSSFYVLGGKTYVLSIFRDITERKLAEEAIRSSEEKFRSVTQSATDAIISADIDGNIISWNNGATLIFGYQEEEILGCSGMTLMPVRYSEHYSSMLKELATVNHTTALDSCRDLYGLRKDGREVPVEVSLSSWTMNDALFHTAIIRDITERKKNEEALIKAKEEAEEATELKEKFVSLVSHDLKSPITTMLGYLQLMRGDTFDSKTMKSFIDEAVASCEDMSTLITEVLDMSRIKSGAIAPKFSFVDAHYIGECVLERYKLMAGGKDLLLNNNIPENTRIYADEKLYFEAFRNIVSNAIKFCRRGDTITLGITKEAPLAITIADTGIGIEPDRLQSLFAYEKKTSTHGTEGESGTGLGLPLSREIMEAQGGKILVESTPGRGSTFILQLPYVKPKVLVIDDDQHIVGFIKKLSEGLNVDFYEALDGKTGLDSIKRHTPHLVLLDMLLPDMDGFELLKKIKNDPATKHMSVIVITCQSEREVAGGAFQYGADDFAAKPFAKESLLARIRRFIV